MDLVFAVRRLNQPVQDKTYPVIAGSYLNIPVTSGSISPARLQALQARLTQTQTALQSGDANLIGALSREDILGDMFHAGGLGYFGQFIALAHLQSLAASGRHHLGMGFGSFGYEPNVSYFFGFPRSLTPGGVAVNVWVGTNYQSLDGDKTKTRNGHLQAGILSSTLEHAVPEQLFNTDPNNPIEGVSAVKALQLAAQQGQRIYEITPQNQATTLPNLNLQSDALSEIAAGLNASKHVIAHTDPISVPGWTGEGYILYDPVDGSGAYKISGGGNGGYTKIDPSGLALAPLALVFSLISPAEASQSNHDVTVGLMEALFAVLFALFAFIKAIPIIAGVLQVMDIDQNIQNILGWCSGVLQALFLATFAVMLIAVIGIPLALPLAGGIVAAVAGGLMMRALLHNIHISCAVQ